MTLQTPTQPAVASRSSRIVLPLAFITVACVAAGVIAFGMRPDAAERHGIWLVVLTRKWQWMLVSVALLACLGLVVSVIGNKAGMGWLIGLFPILGLFYVGFGPSNRPAPMVLVDPPFVESSPQSLHDDDWVVGLTFAGERLAFPYRVLHHWPVVIVTDYDQRMILLFSPHANRALAFRITRDVRPRELEIAASAGNGLLLYNKWVGEFISSVTGLTLDGLEPIGFSTPIATTRTRWSDWRAQHPSSRVLAFPDDVSQPVGPLAPRWKRPAEDDPTPIFFLHTDPPLAVPMSVKVEPLRNLTTPAGPVLLVRDGALIRAYRRQVGGDLFPRFEPRKDRRHPTVVMSDTDSGSLWNARGSCLAGELAGEQLQEIPMESDLYLGVMRYWYPGLQLLETE